MTVVRHRIVKAVAANAAVTAVLLLGMELVAARFAAGAPPPSPYVDSEQLHHAHRPNSSHTFERDHRGSEFPDTFTHVYNDRGWIAEYDIEARKPEGTYRVFYLGDSFIEGAFAMSESVSSRVASALTRSGRSASFEVVNAATASYSPIIHYVQLRDIVLGYEPDLVVISVDMTDDFDDWKYARSAVFDDDGAPVAITPRPPAPEEFVETPAGAIRITGGLRVHLALLSRSALYRFLTDRVLASRAPDHVPGGEFLYRRWAWCEAEWDDETVTNAAFTLDMVGRTVALAREAGVEVVVTAVPHYDQFSSRPGARPLCSLRAHREIERITLAAGGRFLDSHEALRPTVEGSAQSRYYYDEDMHFNPRGNQLWAQAHIDFLLDPSNDLLPQR